MPTNKERFLTDLRNELLSNVEITLTAADEMFDTYIKQNKEKVILEILKSNEVQAAIETNSKETFSFPIHTPVEEKTIEPETENVEEKHEDKNVKYNFRSDILVEDGEMENPFCIKSDPGYSIVHDKIQLNSMITAYGKTMKLRDWAVEKGLDSDTLAGRIYRSGYSVKEALETPLGVVINKQVNTQANKMITYNGVKKKCLEWCKPLGIAPAGLLRRIADKSWSSEKAMTKKSIRAKKEE